MASLRWICKETPCPQGGGVAEGLNVAATAWSESGLSSVFEPETPQLHRIGEETLLVDSGSNVYSGTVLLSNFTLGTVIQTRYRILRTVDIQLSQIYSRAAWRQRLCSMQVVESILDMGPPSITPRSALSLSLFHTERATT